MGFESVGKGFGEAYRIIGFLMSGKNPTIRPKRGSPRLVLMALVTPSRQVCHRRAVGKQARRFWAATSIHAVVKSHLKSPMCMGVPRAPGIGTGKASEGRPKMAVCRVLQREGYSILQCPANKLKAEAVQPISLRDLHVGRASRRQAWQAKWMETRAQGLGLRHALLAFKAFEMRRSRARLAVLLLCFANSDGKPSRVT